VKKILIAVLMLSFAGCGTSIPCTDLASVSQEATLYICNFLSNQPATNDISPYDSIAIGANLQRVQELLESELALASLQTSWYASEGDYTKATTLSQNILHVAAEHDSIAIIVKALHAKSPL
jgi:hypothetical protein